jgi:hypothetical protein
MILAAFVLALAPQDPELGRLLEKLESDSVEVRDAAFDELVARGPGALGEIRRRAAEAKGDLRSRLENAVLEIERRARAAEAQGPPSRVSLKADRMPLREVVESLRLQSPVPIRLEEGVGAEPVTLEFRDLTAFEALDRLCRVHGKLLMRLPWYAQDEKGERNPVALLAGDDAHTRRCVAGPVVVDLREVRRLDVSDLRGKTERRLDLAVQAAWEPALRPTAVRCEMTSVEDERGAAYTLRSRGSQDGAWDTALNLHYHFSLASVPPPGVTAFRRIAGHLELRFPSDVFTARVERPAGKRDVKAEGGKASFTLKSFVLEQGVYRAVLETDLHPRAVGLAGGLRLRALDSRGRPLDGIRSGARRLGSDQVTTMEIEFRAREGVEVAELRAVLLEDDPARPVVRRIPWSFENVPVR